MTLRIALRPWTGHKTNEVGENCRCDLVTRSKQQELELSRSGGQKLGAWLLESYYKTPGASQGRPSLSVVWWVRRMVRKLDRSNTAAKELRHHPSPATSLGLPSPLLVADGAGARCRRAHVPPIAGSFSFDRQERN
ncbi:uncharacterized protein A4U43_C08F2880 [Asparagus officinalis]|nr:uncharacterized protein A4U43_C08F2880 [Asparagus officinalis]